MPKPTADPMPGEVEHAGPRPRRRSRVWRRRLIELALFAVAVYGLHRWQTRGAANGQAPSLVGVDIEGERRELRGPAVVHFWATWCGVCDAMDDNVAALAEDHPVLTVATRSDGAAAIRAHLGEEGLDGAFPVIADPDARLAAQWGVGAFPTTFVVDADGAIRSVTVGYTTTLGLKARAALGD